MKRIILLIALSIGASIALADGNPASYNTKTSRLSLSKIIIDDVYVTNSVTLQLIEITSSGNYLFELDPTTVTLNELPEEPPSCDSNNLDLCTTSIECKRADGYWWTDTDRGFDDTGRLYHECVKPLRSTF